MKTKNSSAGSAVQALSDHSKLVQAAIDEVIFKLAKGENPDADDLFVLRTAGLTKQQIEDATNIRRRVIVEQSRAGFGGKLEKAQSLLSQLQGRNKTEKAELDRELAAIEKRVEEIKKTQREMAAKVVEVEDQIEVYLRARQSLIRFAPDHIRQQAEEKRSQLANDFAKKRNRLIVEIQQLENFERNHKNDFWFQKYLENLTKQEPNHPASLKRNPARNGVDPREPMFEYDWNAANKLIADRLALLSQRRRELADIENQISEAEKAIDEMCQYWFLP